MIVDSCVCLVVRPADPVRCNSLHHLLTPCPGWNREAGGSRGSVLHPHVFRLVVWSGLALLWPGVAHWRLVAGGRSHVQTNAQPSHCGLTLLTKKLDKKRSRDLEPRRKHQLDSHKDTTVCLYWAWVIERGQCTRFPVVHLWVSCATLW